MESSGPLPFLQELLLSGKYSDLIIQCEGQIFKAHRAIICSQSPFFHAAVNGDFRENREGRIELRDEDADTVKRFLSYMYLQDYDQANGSLTLNKTREAGVVGNPDTDSIQDANTAQPSMVAEDASATEVKEIAHNNLRVYIAADKFGTYPLKKLAKDRLVSWAEKNWRDDGFPDAVREIISSVPPQETELCEDLSNVISKNVQSLVERESVLEVLEEFGVLSTAVLEKLVGRLKFSEEERERLITLCRENSFGRTAMRSLIFGSTVPQ